MAPLPGNPLRASNQDAHQRGVGPRALPKVLVLDDDVGCLAEYAECVQSLGYQCVAASDPLEALRTIESDQEIGVVITDLCMPLMDGISFLEEVGARFALLRPVVPVVITGMGSIDSAVQAMNSNAVDFLTKPISKDAIELALRRAFRRRSQLASSLLLAAFVSSQSTDGSQEDNTSEQNEQAPSQKELIKLVKKTIRFRQRRNEFLDGNLFSDPSWDILLELTLAKLQGEPVPVSSACAAAAVPFTTAYRYVVSLVDQKLVKRWKDPLDQRRVLLELEDATLEAMSNFLLSSGMTDPA